MHLQHFDECFFGGHFHGVAPDLNVAQTSKNLEPC